MQNSVDGANAKQRPKYLKFNENWTDKSVTLPPAHSRLICLLTFHSITATLTYVTVYRLVFE